MIKKIFILPVILIIAFFVAFVLFKPQETGQTHIQFASWGSESEVKIIKNLLSDFEKKNPQIKIDFMHIPQNYFQKLHLLFASDTAPDVIFINNQYLPLYANANVLEDMSGYDDIFHYNNFFDKAIESMKWNNKIYAVPRDISNLVIFYNKDLFKKYNVPYPKDDWTLKDFLQMAQKFKNPVWGISFEEEPLFYLPYLLIFNGWTKDDTENYFSEDVLNKADNKNGLIFYSDLRNKYHVAPTKAQIASATMGQLFLQGKIAMHLSGRWLVPKYREDAKFDWDVVEFPKANTKIQNRVFADASGWAVSKNSKHKKEALKLIEFLSSEESSEQFAKSGLIVPAKIKTANSSVFLDGNKPKNAKAFLYAAQKSVPTPVTTNYREILDSLKIRTEYIFNK